MLGKSDHMKSIFNIANIYIGAWCLYMFHWADADITLLSPLSNYILAINLTLSLYFAYKVNRSTHNQYAKAVNLLLIVFSVYGLLSVLSNDVHIIKFSSTRIKNGTYLIAVLRSYLPIYAISYFLQKGYITLESLKKWGYVILSISVYIYIRVGLLRSIVTNGDEFTNNAGYIVLSMFPLVYLYNKRLLQQILCISVISMLVVSSFKRGAVVILLILLLDYLFRRWNSFKQKDRCIFVCLLLLVILLGSNFVSELWMNSQLFQTRVESTLAGNTSGRDLIIDNLKCYYFTKANIVQVLLGSGADATLDVGVNYAHNDWWEILIDQGLLGFCMYIYYWTIFFKVCRRYYGILRECVICTFILYFLKGFFSMSYSMLPLPFAFVMGYYLYDSLIHAKTV